ncbi:MAG: DUF3500 domain-containing protein [Ferruginibacter sp.]|nr:DUF3500 domain-containing protein [Cytophagales bacterium]
MGDAVTSFLTLLKDEQRAQATFPFESEERYDWHFVPRERKGLPLKKMNEDQRKAAMAMIRTGLSEQGYAKATAIMDLENVLRELESRPPDDTRRDPVNYSFSVFGTPSDDQPWGWRVEGHHLSMHFSSVTQDLVVGTPGFMGTNPAIVPSGPQKGKQVLKQETDVGYALLQSFTPEQRKKAIFAEASPYEIFTANSRKAKMDTTVGIAFAEMSADQQKTFRQLLDVYIRNYHKTLANYQMGQLEKAGLDKLHFAWAGSTDRTTGHYYRIHGPTLLIEFDNTQNDANHVHTAVRDLTNDFAEDLLREHYRKHPHQK